MFVDDLLEAGVAGDAGHAEQLEVGVRDGEHEGEGVIDAGVDVEDDGGAHALADEPDLVDDLAEERLVVAGAVRR